VAWSNPFIDQVRLLVAILPIVAKQSCFALKGGTAIKWKMHNLSRMHPAKRLQATDKLRAILFE